MVKVIEKGADSLSVIDGRKTGVQMLSEIRRIKRRREDEYLGETNQDVLIETHNKEYHRLVQENEIPLMEFERLLLMFPKWKNSSSKIGDLMRNIDPNKKYKKEELLKYISRIQDVTTPSRQSGRSGNGMIFKEDDGLYYLYPELISQHKKYFST